MNNTLLKGLSIVCSSLLCLAGSVFASETQDSVARHDAQLKTDTVSVVARDAGGDYSAGRGKVGLVLSGGGAKGIAHVGVIKALEDNDIPIDYVTGTSMGAIVGSLYACGWSPQRMLDLFTSSDFLDWSMGIINKKYLYYFYQQPPTPKWVSVNLNFDKKATSSITDQIIPTSLISPLPMNIEFMRLYGPYTEQCGENFNHLFVPFRCVASDVYKKHKVVFADGSLSDAVRASMSFPMVYRPIEVDGTLMYDGGIYDNFPVNVMQKDFDPSFIIGVSVSGADSKPIKGDMYSQLEDMIIQNNDYTVPADKGVKIQVPVLNFNVLSFSKAKTIYEIGYKTGLSMVDSIKSRISARVPLSEVEARRKQFAEATPELKFDSIRVEGVHGSQATYLKYLFTDDHGEPYRMPGIVNSYYRAVTDGSLNNLLPQAIFGKDGRNTLLLEASPRRPWTMSVGGFVTTSTNSMLYFSAAYHTLGLNSLEASASAWVGQSYYAGMLDAKFSLRTRIPSYVELMGVFSKQKYYENEVLFFKNSSPMFTTELDHFFRAGYVWQIGRTMKGYTSLSGGYLAYKYFLDGAEQVTLDDIDEVLTDASRHDKISYGVALLRAGVEGNTLNNEQYPSAGYKWFVNLDLSYQQSKFDPNGVFKSREGWKSSPVGTLQAQWQQYFPVGRYFALGAYAAGGMSLQKLNQNYVNTKMHAAAFAPTPATQNYFNMAFRADDYLALGAIPIWMPIKNLQLRGDFYAYSPVRELRDNGRLQPATYGGWFRHVRFLGEVAAIYNFPFASVSFYGNYLSYPKKNWNFGISIGLLFRAPKLLRQ